MQVFHLSINRQVFQNAKNKVYPEIVEVKELAELKDAAQYDHVAGEFQNNERSVNNFIRADCVIMDIDNDGTENKEAWIDSARLAKIFPDVEFYIIFSRNDGKQKKNYSPRPRFHVYFPLRQEITDAEQLRGLKEQLLKICPAFDPAAKDAARFLFGVKDAKGLPQRGNLCIDEFVADYKPEVITAELVETETEQSETTTVQTEIKAVDSDIFSWLPKSIAEGERNYTLYSIAQTALIKFNLENAKKIFEEASKRCSAPLPEDELKKIWEQAEKSDVVQQSNELANLGIPIGGRMHKIKLKSNHVSQIIYGYGIKARFNEITGKIEVTNLPLKSAYISRDFKKLTPAKQIEHGAHELKILVTVLLKCANYTFDAELLTEMLRAYINYHAYNPVLDMLKSARWDGVDRIIYLGQILNITGNAHYMTMLRKWLIQAVAILHNEGYNSLDFVLTLQGRQGIGKTEFFRIIGMRPDWVRTGMVIDMTNKDSRIEATSCWICEIGELDSTLKKEQTSLKAFITQTMDRYRRPYAATYEDTPRHTCFCATVNDERFLRDPTGNRRWAVIPVEKIDLAALHSLKTEWLTQLWRQAYELYLNGETFRLTPEERERNEELNKKSVVFLPAEQEILEGLQWGELPEYWKDYTASELKEKISALKNIDVRRIGRALSKLAEDDPRITVSMKHRGVKLYRLPSLIHEASNFYNNR